MPAQVKPISTLSDAKMARVEEFKLLRQMRVVSKKEYEAEVARLNAKQLKEDARYEAKQAEKEKARTIARLAKEKEQEEKRKARQIEINRIRKIKREERRKQAEKKSITIQYSYGFRYKHDKPNVVRTYNGEASEVVPDNMAVDDFVQWWIDEKTQEGDEQSMMIRTTELNWNVSSVVSITPKASNKRVVLMKAVYALGLDGDVEQTWDTGKGKCVYDFLIWRYGNKPGCKKVCNYDSLDFLFKGRSEHEKVFYNCLSYNNEEEGQSKCVIYNQFLIQCKACKEVNQQTQQDDVKWYFENDRMYFMRDNSLNPYADKNPQEDGVCSHQLEAFCDRVGIHMYALDEREKLIHHSVPTKENTHLPPLIYRIKDNHIYPILHRNKSIAERSKRKTEMTYIKKAIEDEEEDEKKAVTIQLMKANDESLSHTERMVQVMKEQGKQVYPFNNIQMSGNNLVGFQLGEVKYMFDEDAMVETAIEIAKANDEPYTGDSVYGILYKLMEENGYTEKSILNPFVFDLLTTPGIKYRTHYGVCDEGIKQRIKDGEDTQSILEELQQDYCVDITKCHTSIYQKPMDDWMLFDFNDEFVSYMGTNDKYEPGLYFVSTNDMTLLHGSNIYSHTILNKARANGIEFSAETVMRPSRKPKASDYFKKLLDAIRIKCKNDGKLMKVLTNIITGMLGKDSTKRTVAKLNTDVSTVWDDFSDIAFQNNKPFIYHVEQFYLYGYSVETTMVENNIPMYIKVLDQANIRLFDMIQKSKCQPIWRKTDCVILRGGFLEIPLVPEGCLALPGTYRKSDFPNILKVEVPVENRKVFIHTRVPGWKHHTEIKSSSQVDDVYSVLRRYRGLCNVSRAGTGKSYNILKVEEKFKAEFPNAYIKKIAFTNKACLNIGGTTIHKFLKIDKSGKFNVDWLKSLADKPVLIMIDEVSMIGSYLWRRLVELKKALPLAHFMLAGDYRQVPPVEEGEPFDYFECPAMKFLANYTRIEFKERQRYDEDLWNFAEEIWEQDRTDTSKIKVIEQYRATPRFLHNKYAICYFNDTRKTVNKMMNDFYADKEQQLVIVFPYKPDEKDEGKKQLQQDAKLYKGLPVIAHHNQKAKDCDELLYANNECFIIKEIDEDLITMVSQRPNEDGEMEDHEVQVPTNEFHKHLLLNYCSTTHKSQGATIDKDIVIYDYQQMTKNIKYTAVTRCKKISQITLVK